MDTPPISPTLELVTFDAARYHVEPDEDGGRVWTTPEGDRLSLSFYFKPPNLPAHSPDMFRLFESIEQQVESETVEIVDFDIPEVDGTLAVSLVVKVPQVPTGRTYLASLTLPFERFSYVLKLQCEERGVTGLREVAAVLQAQEAGESYLEANGEICDKFHPDSSLRDKDFPAHPLSRLRREFRFLRPTIRLDAALKAAAPFPLVKRRFTNIPMT